jgi:hypothetical protein
MSDARLVMSTSRMIEFRRGERHLLPRARREVVAPHLGAERAAGRAEQDQKRGALPAHLREQGTYVLERRQVLFCGLRPRCGAGSEAGCCQEELTAPLIHGNQAMPGLPFAPFIVGTLSWRDFRVFWSRR